MADASPRSARRSRLRPQISLAGALIALTFAAGGIWYWYRVPHEVSHEGIDYALDFDMLKTERLRKAKQVEHVRRVWDGTIRHGLLTTYDAEGQRRAEEEYREGIRHGRYRRWSGDGRLIVEGTFSRGQPDGEWIEHLIFPLSPTEEGKARGSRAVSHWKAGLPHGDWVWRDPAGTPYLTLTFENGRLTGGQVERLDPAIAERLRLRTGQQELYAFLRTVNYDLAETATKDAVDFLAAGSGMRILLDARQLEENGINIDRRVTCRFENLPLAAALKQFTETTGLATQYRFASIWLTAPKAADNTSDPTGIANLNVTAGSKLAAALAQPAKLELVETPAWNAFQYLEQEHGVKFDLSRLLQEERNRPITTNIKDLSLRDALGVMLYNNLFQCKLDGETLVIEPQ